MNPQEKIEKKPQQLLNRESEQPLSDKKEALNLKPQVLNIEDDLCGKLNRTSSLEYSLYILNQEGILTITNTAFLIQENFKECFVSIATAIILLHRSNKLDEEYKNKLREKPYQALVIAEKASGKLYKYDRLYSELNQLQELVEALINLTRIKNHSTAQFEDDKLVEIVTTKYKSKYKKSIIDSETLSECAREYIKNEKEKTRLQRIFQEPSAQVGAFIGMILGFAIGFYPSMALGPLAVSPIKISRDDILMAIALNISCIAITACYFLGFFLGGVLGYHLGQCCHDSTLEKEFSDSDFQNNSKFNF